MRLLLDSNLPQRLAALLQDAGHDTANVRDHGMQVAADEEVLNLPPQQRRTLIFANTDFGTLLARTGADVPSIILIRRVTPQRAEQLAALLLANLDQLMEDSLPAPSSPTSAYVSVTYQNPPAR